MRQPVAPKVKAAQPATSAVSGATTTAKARLPVAARQIARETGEQPLPRNVARNKIAAETQALPQADKTPLIDKAKAKEIKAERKAIKADLRVERKAEKQLAKSQPRVRVQKRSESKSALIELPDAKAPKKPTKRNGAAETEKLASVTQLAPRIAERDSRIRSGKARKVRNRFALVAAVLGFGYLIGFSNYLSLDPEQVVVNAEENTLVDLGAVANLTTPHHHRPLARVRLAELEQKVMEMPAVKQVDIERTWPSGLTFTIESRVPVGAVVTENGFSWIDESGTVVGEFGSPGDLPKLEAPLDQPRVLTDLIIVWRELPAELRERVRALTASTTDDIAAVLTSGQVIRWGSAEQIKLKIATAQALLDTAPKSPVFDVSSPALPITR